MLDIRDYIPYVRLKITTDRPATEVKEIISMNVNRNSLSNMFFNSYPNLAFIGKLTNNHFRLTRMNTDRQKGGITVWGSIVGDIIPRNHQTEINIIIRPPIIPMILWSIFALVSVCVAIWLVFGTIYSVVMGHFTLVFLPLLSFVPLAIHIGLMSIFDTNTEETKNIFKAMFDDDNHYTCEAIPIFKHAEAPSAIRPN